MAYFTFLPLPLLILVGDKLLSFSFLQSSAVCFCIAPQSIFSLSILADLLVASHRSHTSGLSREQRCPGRLKLAQRWPISHVTRTPLSRSKVNLQRAGDIVAASRTACANCCLNYNKSFSDRCRLIPHLFTSSLVMPRYVSF